MAIKTNTELVQKVKDIAINRKTVYLYGTFGSPVTNSVIESKAKQYPAFYTAAKKAELRRYVGKGYFGFDCVGLIKGIFWGWSGSSAANGGAKYATNGVPDISADTMITKCSGVSTNFKNIQVGEAVWCSGHIGIYIGDGLAVECTPRWNNKVQITAVGNIGKKAGYNTRLWTKHGKLPYITYGTQGTTANAPKPQPSTSASGIKAGSVVTIKSGAKYGGLSGTRGKSVPAEQLVPKKHTVKRIQKNKGVQEALLSEIQSWIAVSSLQLVSGGAAKPKIIGLGSKVKIRVGAKDYNGKSVAGFVYNGVYTVDELNGNRAVLDRKGICTAFNVKDLIAQ